MKKGGIFNVPFRRKMEGRTHYKKRLKLLLSDKHRFVVRKSLNNVQVSVIEYGAQGDKILFTVDSKALLKLGWKGSSGNLPSAYLIGMIAGKKAVGKGIKEAILDIGFNDSVNGSRLYAALVGAVDAGLAIPHDPKALPPKERICGEHIAKYAQSLKGGGQKNDFQFSNYAKKGLNPESIQNHFNEIKGKING